MIKFEGLNSVAYCIVGKDQYEFTVKKVTKYKPDPYNSYKCRMNKSPSNNTSTSSDYHYIDCSDNDFCEFHDFVVNFAIKFTYVTFGSILIILIALSIVKCCARESRRRAKRKQEIIDTELLARSAAREAARSTANQIVQQNVTINVTEKNKIMNNVNVNEFDQAQPEPAPRSIFNRNAVINDRKSRKKNNYDEFELEKMELEPQVDY